MRIRVLEHWRQLYSSIHQRSYESNDLLTAGVARLRLSETYAQIDIWQRELISVMPKLFYDAPHKIC